MSSLDRFLKTAWVGTNASFGMAALFGISHVGVDLRNVGDPRERVRSFRLRMNQARIGLGGYVDASPVIVIAHGYEHPSDFQNAQVEVDWEIDLGERWGQVLRPLKSLLKVRKKTLEQFLAFGKVAEKVYEYRDVLDPGVVMLPLPGASFGFWVGMTATDTTVEPGPTLDLTKL